MGTNRVGFIALIIILLSCNTKAIEDKSKMRLPIIGTWKLLSGTIIENGDNAMTDYTRNISFIKIINDSHFAFLKHDLKNGKDSSAVFGCGGGRYSLIDSIYSEHLEYCNDREWENHDFEFILTIKNDTLTQQGIEKIANIGVNRINIEKYVRLEALQR